MDGIPQPSPKDFMAMAYNKKLDLVIKHYLVFCTDTELVLPSGKLHPAYWRIRKFLFSKDPEILYAMYDFLYSFTEKRLMDLTAFFKLAEEQRKKLITKANQKKIAELKVEKFEEISLEDVLKL